MYIFFIFYWRHGISVVQNKCSLQQQNYAVLSSLTHNPHHTNGVRQDVYFENFYYLRDENENFHIRRINWTHSETLMVKIVL